jgi:homoserine kinase
VEAVTTRRRLVRVPASSANLGPGYDVFGAALALHLEVEVEETGSFSVEAEGLDVALDRSNLVVRAFEWLRPADEIGFRIRSEIPLSAGLGSSASAIVAGLVAADHLYELALDPADVLAHASKIEGHPDNVAAALYGGFVVCSRDGEAVNVTRMDPPEGVEAIVVTPRGEEVPTAEARDSIPAEVPHGEAVANVASASELVLGIERSDLALIARGLHDRLHQPHRAHLYPRSMELVEAAPRLGALGATISGAGPTVLVWSFWQSTGKVVEALEKDFGDWADVHRVPFSAQGADVPEL